MFLVVLLLLKCELYQTLGPLPATQIQILVYCSDTCSSGRIHKYAKNCLMSFLSENVDMPPYFGTLAAPLIFCILGFCCQHFKHNLELKGLMIFIFLLVFFHARSTRIDLCQPSTGTLLNWRYRSSFVSRE